MTTMLMRINIGKEVESIYGDAANRGHGKVTEMLQLGMIQGRNTKMQFFSLSIVNQ